MGVASGPVWLGRTGRFDRVERTAGGPAARLARTLRVGAAANVPCCDDATRQGGDGMVFHSRPAGGWDVFPADQAPVSS